MPVVQQDGFLGRILKTKQGREAFLFIVVGVVAAATDFVGYHALTHWFPDYIALSKATSYIGGNIVSFLGHRFVVFEHGRARSAKEQLMPFVGVYVVSWGINTGVNEAAYLQFTQLGSSWLFSLVPPKTAAWFVATTCSTIANFIGVKFFVFHGPKKPGGGADNDALDGKAGS